MIKEIFKKFKFIMIIDDCAIDLHLKKKLIYSGNYTENIIEYQSASKALEYLTDVANFTNLPQVIILDMHMPDMTGLDFMEEYNKLPIVLTANCRIFVVSSTSDEVEIKRIENYKNVMGFQRKPLTSAFLDSL